MASTTDSYVLPYPSYFTRAKNGLLISALKTVITPLGWIDEANQYFWPPEIRPDIVKTYEPRSYLPVRLFFPHSYDQTSNQTLPLVYSIHGGGFVLGAPRDSDEWNRRFADMHNVMVVALNYTKAPFWATFPNQGLDLEALIHAVYDDESLPIDKNRIAITGFSAGGNLALSVCQLPSIRDRIKPSAVIPIYPPVDMSINVERLARRYYKPELGEGPRAAKTDTLASMASLFDWSYIPYGQDLRDPLLSPVFATRAALPPYVYVVAAELDQLAHEAWRLAFQLSGRPEPTPDNKVGQEKPAKEQGHLILDDERFAFQHTDDRGSVQWLLVPDQIHGFDHMRERMQGSQGFQDALLKTVQYQQILGEWLRDVVWKDERVVGTSS
ncbi:alpha/beta hydrolase fold protein [Pseudomassariella vexata]|uniref:Alpha/beta hydrolase fold protein n=1 Tax=Pseudomassariella vexata TaxID=1141098 RepID=A0A1Y2DQ97_9PEZI|nr:alpha/beta hydrolase fold protein [Pseudomassariella vexata]ORY61430.1 alpha/beta hydrolase fold protein [Pseudomassariella vexata]